MPPKAAPDCRILRLGLIVWAEPGEGMKRKKSVSLSKSRHVRLVLFSLQKGTAKCRWPFSKEDAFLPLVCCCLLNGGLNPLSTSINILSHRPIKTAPLFHQTCYNPPQRLFYTSSLESKRYSGYNNVDSSEIGGFRW
jgi:hypothetical protein